MIVEINKNITKINRTIMNNRKIEWLVIHWVGAVSSAKANTVYFKSENRKASADYFVDDNAIWQCVEDKDAAWHCGGGLQGLFGHKYYKICTNSNSIGIEMCCYKNSQGKLDISEKTVERTIELVKYLMKKYNISADHVIRHYDVTGKNCPAPFVKDNARWENFKSRLSGGTVTYKPTQATGLTVVKEWQKVMNDTYKCGLAVDGSYGPASQNQANKHYLHYKKPAIKNAYVGFIQKRLNFYGIKCSIDNSFGPATRKAVIQFQKKKGLKADGFVGAGTVRKLLGL